MELKLQSKLIKFALVSRGEPKVPFHDLAVTFDHMPSVKRGISIPGSWLDHGTKQCIVTTRGPHQWMQFRQKSRRPTTNNTLAHVPKMVTVVTIAKTLLPDFSNVQPSETRIAKTTGNGGFVGLIGAMQYAQWRARCHSARRSDTYVYVTGSDCMWMLQ